jgi:hypothetical protein
MLWARIESLIEEGGKTEAEAVHLWEKIRERGKGGTVGGLVMKLKEERVARNCDESKGRARRSQSDD